MKTLIINGSPRRNGDTAALIAHLKSHLEGEITEISAYRDKISPCIDCRYCWKHKGCAIKDDMAKIYADDFDNVVIASPVHMSNLTAPLIGIASRLQAYYAAKYILKDSIVRKRKRGILCLVGGGDGTCDEALTLSKMMFRQLNAAFDMENAVFSLKTDTVPAGQDKEALSKIEEIAKRLNAYASDSASL